MFSIYPRYPSATGWSIDSDNCNISLAYWKIPKWGKKYLFKSSYWEVWLFTLLLLWAKQFGHTKTCHCFGNQWKVVSYTGCQTKFIVEHLVHFWPFLKALADRTAPATPGLLIIKPPNMPCRHFSMRQRNITIAVFPGGSDLMNTSLISDFLGQEGPKTIFIGLGPL